MIRRPAAILALLTGLNFLNYLDRTLVSSVLKNVQEDLSLSNFEGGLLATAFLLGYFLTAPIFSALSDRYSRRSLIAFGVATWSLATAASGLANSLTTLLIARAVVGIGEASYATLAPTIIDDITPPEKKGKALAIFYLAIPLGSALGFGLGGVIGKHAGWRTAFFVGGGPGILLALTCLLIAEPARLEAARNSVVAAARALWRIALYRRTVFGYIAHTAALGAFAHWGPKFLAARYDLATDKAGVWFGGVTVIAGAIGTIIGGRWVDRVLVANPAGADHDAPATKRGTNALLRICAIGVAIAAPFAVAAFAAPTAPGFFALVFVVEVGVFLSTSPVNAALLRTVPASLRASSMAVAIFAIHIFGDLGSPPAIGLLLDHLAIVAAMMGLPVLIGLAAVLWWPRPREAD